jgi:hypothetical protein
MSISVKALFRVNAAVLLVSALSLAGCKNTQPFNPFGCPASVRVAEIGGPFDPRTGKSVDPRCVKSALGDSMLQMPRVFQ